MLGRISGRLRPRSGAAAKRSVTTMRPPYQVLIVLGLLVAAVAAGVGGLIYEDRRLHALEQARGAALSAAETHAVELLSYDYRTIEDDVDRASAAATGTFRTEYVDTFEKVLYEQAKAQQTVVQAEVRAASVVEADTDRAVVLLFVNQATQKKTAEETKIDQPRVQMTLKKVNDKWLVAGVKSF